MKSVLCMISQILFVTLKILLALALYTNLLPAGVLPIIAAIISIIACLELTVILCVGIGVCFLFDAFKYYTEQKGDSVITKISILVGHLIFATAGIGIGLTACLNVIPFSASMMGIIYFSSFAIFLLSRCMFPIIILGCYGFFKGLSAEVRAGIAEISNESLNHNRIYNRYERQYSTESGANAVENSSLKCIEPNEKEPLIHNKINIQASGVSSQFFKAENPINNHNLQNNWETQSLIDCKAPLFIPD